jgi:aarF domain-containing kinase
MNTFSVSAFATRIAARPWTCSTCRGQLLRGKPLRYITSRNFASRKGSRGDNGQKSGPRRPLLYASAGAGTIGATALALGDDIKNSYEAAERTGRVAAALAVCINDYRTTLNARETTEDHDEQENMLKACHQRCAERTLIVLEKNGGIFIKLGQHLVRIHPPLRKTQRALGMLTIL